VFLSSDGGKNDLGLLAPELCNAVTMSKAEDAKADRELMARIVKKHEAAKKKLAPKLEDFRRAVPRVVRAATKNYPP
jgi:hypothetical protein